MLVNVRWVLPFTLPVDPLASPQFNQLETQFELHDITDDDERDIPSRFLRRVHKPAGFGTTAVVGKAVIQQAFIKQMPASIRAHLAITPDSTSLESLAVLADRAIASENDAKDNGVGVAEVRVNDREKLIGILEDISKRLKKLETSGHQKQQYNNKQQTTRGRDRTTENEKKFPNANARPFTTRIGCK